MTRLIGSDQEERTQQKTSIVQPGPINENPVLREVDLEPSAKRETDRTKVLVSLYWSSQSLPLKQPVNRTSSKSTLVDPIVSNLKGDQPISKTINISKPTLQKPPIQSMLMTGDALAKCWMF